MEWYYVLIIVIGLLLVSILAIIALYMSYITPISTEKISDNVYAIKSGIVNCFVYSIGAKKIIIDAGMSAKKVEKEMSKIGIKPDSISHVFLTHSDADHMGGLSIFNHANLYIGKGAKIEDPKRIHFLEDNEIVEVDGIKIQTISTPGHRSGHSAYLVDDKFIFTGDALRLKDGIIKPFIRLISSDYKKQLESIKKIAKLKNISILLTAHNGYTKDFSKATKDWKD
jgi:glyoxylase-like metal-dependent hydrolase (beta-lactamase superfamily II)